jgi:hypothetical protein
MKRPEGINTNSIPVWLVRVRGRVGVGRVAGGSADLGVGVGVVTGVDEAGLLLKIVLGMRRGVERGFGLGVGLGLPAPCPLTLLGTLRDSTATPRIISAIAKLVFR